MVSSRHINALNSKSTYYQTLLMILTKDKYPNVLSTEKETYSNIVDRKIRILYENDGTEKDMEITDLGEEETSDSSEDANESNTDNLIDDIIGEEISQSASDEFYGETEKTVSMLETVSEDRTSLKGTLLSASSYDSVNDVCNEIIGDNPVFQNLCKSSELFFELEKLKMRQKSVYLEIINESYRGNKPHFNLELLKDTQGKSFLKEEDTHDPKFSALFIFSKFCYSGISMACANVTKVYDEKGKDEKHPPGIDAKIQEKISETKKTKETTKPSVPTKPAEAPKAKEPAKPAEAPKTKEPARPAETPKTKEDDYIEPYVPTDDVEPYVPTDDDVEPYVPTGDDVEPYVPTGDDVEPYVSTGDDVEPSVSTGDDVEPYVPEVSQESEDTIVPYETVEEIEPYKQFVPTEAQFTYRESDKDDEKKHKGMTFQEIVEEI